jgi:hypothetical protein
MSSTTSSNTILTNSLNAITPTTGAISIGDNQTDGILNLGTGVRTATGVINIATAISNACDVNIKSGLTTSGSVNIANGTGITQSTAVNIGSGSTTGVVTIGNTNNSILLNAPTTINSTKQKITYFTTQTNTLTVANILASNFFGSTYSSANPTVTNDIITVNLPTPTVAMEGMTLTFRKIRGAVGTATTNWTFVCPTSSFVQTGLTASTPTVSTQNNGSTLVRYTVLGYGGVYYYFVM